MHHAIIADTAISERQKQVLLDIYTSFCQQNEAAREGRRLSKPVPQPLSTQKTRPNQ